MSRPEHRTTLDNLFRSPPGPAPRPAPKTEPVLVVTGTGHEMRVSPMTAARLIARGAAELVEEQAIDPTTAADLAVRIEAQQRIQEDRTQP
jgi:hypothetical protein